MKVNSNKICENKRKINNERTQKCYYEIEFVWKNSDKMQIRKNMVGTIAKEWKKVTKNCFQ